MRALAILALLASSSCSAVLRFDQCTSDDECVLADGGTGYCTNDHICTTDLPSDRICAIDDTSSSGDPTATTIAGLFRLTGPTASKDTAIEAGVQLAVQQVNSSMLRPLRLVVCDTQGDPTLARKAMTVAVEKFGAVAVIGPTSSSEVLAIGQPGNSLAVKYGVPVISGSATSPAISSLGDLVQTPVQDNGSTDGQVSLIWRTAASDTVQAKVLASRAIFSTYSASTDVRVAYVNSSYGSGLSDAYDAQLAANYAGISPTAQGFDEGTSGVDVATFLGMGAPQVAMIVADADAPSWLAALFNANGLSGTQFLFTDGAKGDNLFTDLATTSSMPAMSFLARVQGTGPGLDKSSAAYAELAAKFPDGDASANAFVANTYDATFAVALAMGIVASGPVYGSAIADGLSRLSSGRSFNVGGTDFPAAYMAMRNEGGIDLHGASGPIDFDPMTGDVTTAPIEIWGVDDSSGTPKFTTINVVTP